MIDDYTKNTITTGEIFMFARLFGGSEEEVQFEYLQKRVVITVIAFVITIIGSIFYHNAIAILALVALFIWGWNATKKIFGFATIAILFSKSFGIGFLLFVLALFVAYFLGVIVGFIGVIRYIQLRVKFSKQAN